MDETISAIDTITLRIPLDIWAPAPMSQGVPRTHVGKYGVSDLRERCIFIEHAQDLVAA
jgi:hypothetical protein